MASIMKASLERNIGSKEQGEFYNPHFSGIWGKSFFFLCRIRDLIKMSGFWFWLHGFVPVPSKSERNLLYFEQT